MPKKTKKQKVLAELRRKLVSVSKQSKQSKASQAEIVKRQTELVKSQKNLKVKLASNPNTSTFVYEKRPVIKPQIAISTPNYSYVKNDLIKITIFAIFALLFQSVVYFLQYRR